jgi:ketosteroid isomerase-like protein
MRITILLCHLSAALLLSACSVMTASNRNSVELQLEVADTERAFARTMAERDHTAFTRFLSDEAVFFSGTKVLRGKQQVADAWKRLYQGPTAPFSWQPEQVEVLQSGSLAISSGPVRDAQGKLIATFSSIWRQEAPGVWRIVFDKGNDVCDCVKP